MTTDEGTGPPVEAAPVPVKERGTRRLPCRLSAKEAAERAQAMARILTEIKDEKALQEGQKREMKDTLANLEAALESTYRVVLSGTEERDVEVEEQMLYDVGKVDTVRLDTTQVIHSRRMTPEEMQTTMAVL